MRDKEDIIVSLAGFRCKDKFSYYAFQERGLIRSNIELCNRLEGLLNGCADQLTAAIENDASDQTLIKILRNNLYNLRKSDYHATEREFICDYFYELSLILALDIKNDLNSWLYGKVFGALIRLGNFLRGLEKIAETQEQPCTNCNISLKTVILKKAKGITDYNWNIIRCNNCNEYNLLSLGPDVKAYRAENYQSADQLPKADYNEEEAKIRLEQIKFFRGK